MKLYAIPHEVCVGEKSSWGQGEIAHPEWRSRVQGAGYRPEIMDKVDSYLEAFKPKEEDEDDA
jgi:hypothetical protein